MEFDSIIECILLCPTDASRAWSSSDDLETIVDAADIDRLFNSLTRPSTLKSLSKKSKIKLNYQTCCDYWIEIISWKLQSKETVPKDIKIQLGLVRKLSYYFFLKWLWFINQNKRNAPKRYDRAIISSNQVVWAFLFRKSIQFCSKTHLNMDFLTPEASDSLSYLSNLTTELTYILPQDPHAIAEMKIESVQKKLLSFVSWEHFPHSLEPGLSSQSGFLQKGQSIWEVIHQDAVCLASLGVSHTQFADYLESEVLTFRQSDLTEKLLLSSSHTPQSAIKHLEKNLKSIEQRLKSLEARKQLSWKKPIEIIAEESFGFQNCPLHPSFDNPMKLSNTIYIFKYTYVNTDISADECKEENQVENVFELRFGGLQISLIRQAAFFEGPECDFRIEPSLVIPKLLDHKL